MGDRLGMFGCDRQRESDHLQWFQTHDRGAFIMGKTLQEKLSQLPQDRQDRIRQQAEQLIAEELSLRDLRSKRDGCDRSIVIGHRE
jgi:hypothetical protein